MSSEDKPTIIKRPEGGFRGPLDFWPWPLINLIMAFIERIKARSGSSYGGASRRTKITEVRPTSEGGWSILEHEV